MRAHDHVDGGPRFAGQLDRRAGLYVPVNDVGRTSESCDELTDQDRQLTATARLRDTLRGGVGFPVLLSVSICASHY